jgi:tape measure domain-containing protein
VRGTLHVLGNLAAASGANIGDLAQIFGKIKSQGKVMGETLNQLAERGIPIISALAAHFKVPEEAIRDMVSKGKVSFQDFEAAMNSLGGEGGKFGNLMAEQADTLAGKWSTFKDKIKRFSNHYWPSVIANDDRIVKHWVCSLSNGYKG